MSLVNQESLDTLFRNARTYSGWQEKPIEDSVLKELYELAKMGPTSMNSLPARFVFLTTPQSKEKLKPALSEGNIKKAMTAPVTVIVAYDSLFYEYLPVLFPHSSGAKDRYANNAELAKATAFRNGSLQGAYLILAARALGLDCGPMSGFNNTKVDELFFPDGRLRSNFLLNLGYGDENSLRPRGPRLGFDEACTVL